MMGQGFADRIVGTVIGVFLLGAAGLAALVGGVVYLIMR